MLPTRQPDTQPDTLESTEPVGARQPLCIYCLSAATAREHWLLESLGTFGPLQILRGTICDDCNVELGKTIDRDFVRLGFEGVYRSRLGLEGDGVGAAFGYRAATTQPTRAHSLTDDTVVLWGTKPSPSGDGKGELLQQVVVTGDDGIRRACQFKLEWTADVLRQALKARGIHGGKLTEVYASQETTVAAKPLLKEVFGSFSAESFDVTGGEESVRRLLFVNELRAEYFRAVAKMALHFALAFVGQLDGHAWEIDRIRRFIRFDERPRSNPVTRLPSSLAMTLANVLPQRMGHIFWCRQLGNEIVVQLQCFATPGLPEEEMPPAWNVRLGRSPVGFPSDVSKLVVASFHDEPQPSGHRGDIIVLPPP